MTTFSVQQSRNLIPSFAILPPRTPVALRKPQLSTLPLNAILDIWNQFFVGFLAFSFMYAALLLREDSLKNKLKTGESNLKRGDLGVESEFINGAAGVRVVPPYRPISATLIEKGPGRKSDKVSMVEDILNFEITTPTWRMLLVLKGLAFGLITGPLTAEGQFEGALRCILIQC